MDTEHDVSPSTSSPANEPQPAPESHVAPSTPRSFFSPPSNGHKRRVSGHILAKIPFLRRSSDDNAPDNAPDNATDSDGTEPFPNVPGTVPEDLQGPTAGSSIASETDGQIKTRKARESLRKTAMLGTGKLLHYRRSSNADILPKSSHEAKAAATRSRSRSSNHVKVVAESPRKFIFHLPETPPLSQSFPSAAPDSAPKATSLPLHSASALLSPVTSSASTYASTTDEDFSPTLVSSPDSASQLPPILKHASPSPSPPSSESSLTVPLSIRQRKSASTASNVSKPKSPLGAMQYLPPLVSSAESDEWDYAETEWWGWIILVVTWIVFVVGMGSCLGVWSWAWDVGERPNAPPELSDDSTLPIVGYYPALMVLTAVMSWVWVVVAWVGMKYFRHAKITAD